MANDDKNELVSRLFALLTAKFEDGAAEAAQGQGQGGDSQTTEQIAIRSQAFGEEIALIAEATRYLIGTRD